MDSQVQTRQQQEAARSPMAAYRTAVGAGALAHDPMQELAAEMLETLHHRLAGYEPGGNGGLMRFLGRGRREAAPQGLYLYGDVGRGKSMLMDLFFAGAPVAKKRRVHFHEFMQEIHETIHGWRQMDARERERAGMPGDDPLPPLAGKIADGATLLCFDEFQVADVADAMILGRLFCGLFENGVVIVLTSNTAPDHLYAGGLNRDLFLPFVETIMARLDLLHLASPTDYRLARMRGVPVYHTPLGDQAAAELDEAFFRLTDLRQGDRQEIEVKGRKLAVPQAARGVARLTFDGLCGKTLGAADYLALTEHFHTLILSDIPRMKAEHRNEAKRFITLIDTLYDRHIRLICSAAAPPAELYEKGDGDRDFARTVSRLIEMRSHDYFTGGRG